MVDAIVREWVRVLQEVHGMGLEDVRRLLACFYADDGMIVARDPDDLQVAFDVLTGLFDRVGLRTNTTKTEAMVFLPGKIRTPLTAESYEARMDDVYRAEKTGRRVECHICQSSLAVGSLRSHLSTQHDEYQCFVVKDSQEGPLLPPRRLTAAFFHEEGKFRCPVPACPQGHEGRGCKTPFNLRWHFAYRHPRDKVVIRGECLPRCPCCGMQVAREVLGTTKHEESKTCKQMAARRRQHTVAAEGARALTRTFTAYGESVLRRVERFKYLGRVLSYDDSDTPAIRRNLKRARQVWGRISTVIAKDAVPAPIAGMFYQAVVAAVLLYGSETWVTPPHDLRAMEGFHVEAARRITGMRPQKRGETWVYPKSVNVRRAARVKTIVEYIADRRRNILLTIADRPILEECRRVERRQGSPPRLYWWEQ